MEQQQQLQHGKRVETWKIEAPGENKVSPRMLLLPKLVNDEETPSYSGIQAHQQKQEHQEELPKRKAKLELIRVNSLSIQMDISEILDYLYLGAKTISEDAQSLKDMGITYVINCTVNEPNHFEGNGVVYMRIAVEDRVDDLACLKPFFDSSGDFIEIAKNTSSKVLVHCTMGMSRSSTIVIAYLMKHKDMNLATALQFTKERRAMVSPNSGFMKQLIEFEEAIFGKVTIDLELYKKGRFEPVRRFLTEHE